MGPIIGYRRGVQRDVRALFEQHPDEWMCPDTVKRRVQIKAESARHALAVLLGDGVLEKEVLLNPRRVRYKLAQQGETT